MDLNKKPYLKFGFPKAILHVDGDGFFAGCEVAKDPRLKGKPVVVGRERGMALAMTQEAKVKGVKRGMTLSEARRVCPDAIFVDMDHESYGLFSGRMNSIIERYTPMVERYSIDESFADLSGMRLPLHMSYKKIGEEIKQTLKSELGMTFSLGIAPTKVLAKCGSKYNKPDGLTIIPGPDIEHYLEQIPIGNIWGIGRQTTEYLEKYGIKTARDFTDKTLLWVNTHLAKPYQEIWHELRGESVMPLNIAERPPEHSLMRTRTFTPPRNDLKYVLSELSRHTEVVCARAREHGLAGRAFSFFIKTQGFKYEGLSFRLNRSVNIPEELIALIAGSIEKIWDDDTLYRTAGVTLFELGSGRATQLDLFDTTLRVERLERTYEAIDEINRHFGAPLIHLGGSTHMYREKKKTSKDRDELLWERTGIPCLGSVS